VLKHTNTYFTEKLAEDLAIPPLTLFRVALSYREVCALSSYAMEQLTVSSIYKN